MKMNGEATFNYLMMQWHVNIKCLTCGKIKKEIIKADKLPEIKQGQHFFHKEYVCKNCKKANEIIQRVDESILTHITFT
jgi:DNA-directed RNA polymerase subunit RPC12/RpoP